LKTILIDKVSGKNQKWIKISMLKNKFNVVLIGDSIRMGYEDVVRQHLSGIASVWAPKDNGGHSRNILAHLDEWVLTRHLDIVYINCGLHDIARKFDLPDLAVPLSEYRKNIRHILSLIKSKTNTVVIWASITPVNEQWHHANKGFDRLEADVVSYNTVANEVANECEVPIHDLFGIVQQSNQQNLLSSDGVHFTSNGYDLLGNKVAEFIKARFLTVKR
jgi:lysophospholipase L1-like esterase